MRVLCVIVLFVLAGCHGGPEEISKLQGNPMIEASAEAIAQSGSFDAVVAKVYPIAHAMCRAKNPNKDAKHCAFRIVQTGSVLDTPNASQSIGADGRPVIKIGRALIAEAKTADELAFVIAHEAGHQIGNHLERLGGGKTHLGLAKGATSSGLGIRKANPKALELEADAIGAIIAFRAGFDPIAGSKALRRFTPISFGPNDTHPPVATRISIVEKTTRHLKAGNEISL